MSPASPGFFCFKAFGGNPVAHFIASVIALDMEILRFPLARFTICFIPGIIWGYHAEPALFWIAGLTVIGLGLLAVVYFWSVRAFVRKIFFGVLVCPMAFLCGALSQSAHAYYNDQLHYVQKINREKNVGVALLIRERLKNGATATRYVADVVRIDANRTRGKILVHCKDLRNLPVGTMVAARGKIFRNSPPLNPGQFNYAKYLDNKSIPAQLYLEKGHYRVCGTSTTIGHYADRLRSKMIDALRREGFNEIDLQVLHALILGQQQEISPDIVRDYQFAGAVHILSVSGLHVGFVLLFVNSVLSRLPKTKKWHLIKLFVVLLSLWIFAFIAGLSPSVVRSATMFSFVAIGMNLNRSTNMFHTLVVSLLLILLFEPAFVFDVGFQLSYAALFFIIWLEPLFSSLWSPSNRIVSYFWGILSVSFAAQIGTLPLSIYYFHQFPTLFFITNLAVIPMLSAIMGLGIVVMVPAVFGYVVPFLAKLLEMGIGLLNKIIGVIASFEQFVITDIPLTFLQLIAGYLSLICVIMWFKKPNGFRLVAAGIAVLFFQIGIISTQWHNQQLNEFLVFHVPKETLIVVRNGKTVSVFGKTHRSIENFTIENFTNDANLETLQNVYWVARKKIMVMNAYAIQRRLNPSVVILCRSPKINLERWLKTNRPEVIVADGSNYKTDVERWKATCSKQKIPFHYTKEKGFFKLSD